MAMMVGDDQYRNITLSVKGAVTVIMMEGCASDHPEAVAPCYQGTGAQSFGQIHLSPHKHSTNKILKNDESWCHAIN